MNLLTVTKEPIFASGVKRRGKVIVYLDKDGMMACTNLVVGNNRICCVCGNQCVLFVVDEHGEYTCSACGKFPRELLLQ